QLCPRGIIDRSAFELPTPRIHHPHALPGLLAELRPEVTAVIARRFVRRVCERHLGRRAPPGLVGERGAIHADHLVEPIGIAALAWHEEDRRALVRDESLPVDEKFVPLGFAAENRMVVEDETAPALVLLEEDRGGE